MEDAKKSYDKGPKSGPATSEARGGKLDPNFLLEKLWQSYSVTDDRRRKNFYYLFYYTLLLALVWIGKSQSITFQGITLPVRDVFIVAPALLVFFTVRYFYLCSHTLRSFVWFLEGFEQHYRNDLETAGYRFRKLAQATRLKDLSEELNVFLVPTKPFKRAGESSIKRVLYLTTVYVSDAVILLSVLIPMVSYFLIILWLLDNSLTSTVIGIVALGLYCLLAFLLLISPVHFYLWARKFRAILSEKTYSE